MTHQNDYTFADEIAEKGLDVIPELMQALINQAMQRSDQSICGLMNTNEQKIVKAK